MTHSYQYPAAACYNQTWPSALTQSPHNWQNNRNGGIFLETYRKLSNIRRTKSQHLNDSRLILQMSLPNLLKPGVKLRMKM